jgi:hypothetical protein
MSGKKSHLGRNDIKNWLIRSFWGRYGLKWGFTSQFTKLPETNNAPYLFFNGLVWSGQTYGREYALNS